MGNRKKNQSVYERNSAYAQYQSRSYEGGRGAYVAQKESKAPIIVLVVALLVALALLGLAIHAVLTADTQKTADSSEPAATETMPATTTTPATSTPATSDILVMTLAGSQDTYVLKGETYIESGCHATDKETGNVTPSVKTTGTVDANTVGTYDVTYTATDHNGATASKVRHVHVVDSMDADTDGISVLMYHYVYEGTPAEENANYLDEDKLEEQLQWLTSENYYYPSYQELEAYIEGTHSLPAKSVVLTFDDGETGFLNYGIPMLEKYQVPATSFVICIDDDAEWKTINYASEYCSFQSHTYSLHTAGYSGRGKGGRIYDLTTEELVEDFQSASKILGTNEALAYPFGDYDEEAQQAIRDAGILCAFTVNYGQVHTGDDRTCLSRIRVFASSSLEGFIAQVEDGA